MASNFKNSEADQKTSQNEMENLDTDTETIVNQNGKVEELIKELYFEQRRTSN